MITPFLFILTGTLSGMLMSELASPIPLWLLLALTFLFFLASYFVLRQKKRFNQCMVIYLGGIAGGLVNYRAVDRLANRNTEEKIMRCELLHDASWHGGEEGRKFYSRLEVETGEEKLLLSLYSAKQIDLKTGAKIEAKVKLRPFKGKDAPGCFDRKSYYARRNIYREGTIKGKYITVDRSAAEKTSLMRRLHEKAYFALQSEKYPNAALLLRLMLLGSDESLPSSLEKGLRKSGVAHILAVSGLHIGLISGVWLMLLRAFGVSRLALDLPLLPFLWFYVLFLGDRPSVLRAVILMTLIVLGRVFNKATLSLHFLAVAAWLYAIISPKQIFSYSSLLSFSATAALLILLPAIAAKLEEKREGLSFSKKAKLFIKEYFVQSLKITFCVTIFTLPVILAMLHMVTPLGFLMNMIIIPLCAILLSAGFWRLAVFYVLPTSLSSLFYDQALCVWERFMPLVASLGDSPYLTLNVPPFSLTTVFAYYLAIGFFALHTKTQIRSYRDAFLCLLLFLCFRAFKPPVFDDALKITALDVGQGDCFVMRSDLGPLFVMDCGRSMGSSSKGETVVVPYLRNLGVQKIDCLYISHYDDDHMGGARDIISEIRTKTIVAPPYLHSETNGWELMRLAQKLGVRWVTLTKGCKFGNSLALWPPNDPLPLTSNSRSLVLLTPFKGCCLMWTGDLPKTCEFDLLRGLEGGLPPVAVYKIPHHGSSSAGSDWFLAKLRPKISLLSVGPNPYGHPHKRLMEKYARFGYKVLRTDELGTYTLILRETGKTPQN
ncbi:DNA internalization-related competence protein ComEC/Rec2 [bacterium]|nr:DNA internalization-related competence protein ComEC/Rec2 [bacterium]